jgi:hypothetical protein
LASELWDAAGDRTLPIELSLDHVWITAEGRAVLLDDPWPGVQAGAAASAGRIRVDDVAGQQSFLAAVAACVESTSLPLHARRVLQNLESGKFEKLSFLTGTLRGLLERPAEVSRGVRAGSIFLLPVYMWLATFVGRYHDKPWKDMLGEIIVVTALVLGLVALMKLLALPFHYTASHAIFRLAVIDARGELASRMHLLSRWAVVWIPLLLPMSAAAWLAQRDEALALIAALGVLVPWVGAAVYAAASPHRGLQDRWARTWVVRR